MPSEKLTAFKATADTRLHKPAELLAEAEGLLDKIVATGANA